MADSTRTLLYGFTLGGLFRSGAFLASLLFCLFLWVLDPLFDDNIFGEGSFLERFYVPAHHEIHFRIFTSLVALLSGLALSLVQQRLAEQNRRLREDRQMLRQIISAEPECVKTISASGELLEMNPAGLAIIQADDLQRVRGHCVYDLVAPEDREAFIAFNETVFRGEPAQLQFTVVGLKGRRVFVDSHAVPLFDDEGKVRAHLAVTRDITETRRYQNELLQFSTAIEQCASMVMITDAQTRITYVNDRFCEVSGYPREELIGEQPMFMLSRTQDRTFYDKMEQQIRSGQVWRGKIQNQRRNGDLYWVSVVISPIRDQDGRISRYLCTQEDITETHRLAEQLDYQARHCLLTGLVNRHEFERHLAAVWRQARDSENHHAVFFIDLDQFKMINDTCGHMAGDQLLRQVGRQIQAQVRKRDLVARLGGDEFAVLLEQCSADKAMEIAESLRQAIEAFAFAWGDQLFRPTVSIGVVDVDRHCAGAAEVLRDADAACYVAKERGRNKVYLHQDRQAELRRNGDIQWISRIHDGLEQGRFCLFVQDIVGLQSPDNEHFEVLLRYRGCDGNLVPPGAFLPPAERFGLSPKLDRWVIEEVCRLLAANPDRSPRLSINLSGLSVADDELLPFVRRTIETYAIPAQHLCFEITETAAISSLANATRFIQDMKSLGCRFALDDFGSGLSSFGYLKNLPVDFVKIDGIFVRDMVTDSLDLAMVRSINDIGQLMGKKTIAEFVENDEIARLLRDLGVDYAQGYGIARPRPIGEILPREAQPAQALAGNG